MEKYQIILGSVGLFIVLSVSSIVVLDTIMNQNKITLVGDHVFESKYKVTSGQTVIFKNGEFTFQNPEDYLSVYGAFIGENVTIKGKIKAYEEATVEIIESPHTVWEIYAYQQSQITIRNSTVYKIYAYDEAKVTVDDTEYYGTSEYPNIIYDELYQMIFDLNSTLQEDITALGLTQEDVAALESMIPLVAILDPDFGQTVSGVIKVRALILAKEGYSVEVFVNNSLETTSLPFSWDTTLFSDGFWNLTVRVMSGSETVQDWVLVEIENDPLPTFWYINDASGQYTTTSTSWESTPLSITVYSKEVSSYFIQLETLSRVDTSGYICLGIFINGVHAYSMRNYNPDWITISISYVAIDLTAGLHTIQVQVYISSTTTGYYYHNSLFIQRI